MEELYDEICLSVRKLIDLFRISNLDHLPTSSSIIEDKCTLQETRNLTRPDAKQECQNTYTCRYVIIISFHKRHNKGLLLTVINRKIVFLL